LLEPRSFDAHKNATAPMIAMIDHSEIDTEVSDAGMETAESNDCREVSRDDGDVNGMLATIQEEARFFHKNRWNFINPFVQSISRLCWASQLYLRTKEQEESSRVTKKFRFIQSLVGKIMGKLAVSEIVLFDELSNKWRATGRVADVFK